MSTIVTRAGKGSALTHNEVDANFTNLNTDKLQSGDTAAALTITSATFGAGTVSAPSLTTSGDTNTGIFFPAADTIAFAEGGVESMRIDSSGSLGIGTSSPLTKLNVNGTDGELIRISVTPDTGAIQEPALGFATGVVNTHPAVKISALEFDASDSRASLLFYTRDTNSDVAPTERMRIDSSGNVGIGTAAPGALLDVTASNNGLTSITANNALRFTDADITTAANQPIGVIEFYTSDTSAGGTGVSAYILSAAAGTSGGGDLRFGTAGNTSSGSPAERLRIVAADGTLTSQPTYDNTAAGSTVVVTSAGLIRRTSSSLKYKKDVETLDYSLASNAIENLRPVWYRTKTAAGDDKETWSHIGLIAEEVHEIEPRLVRYRTVEVNTDEFGERVETPLEVPEPEDVDYGRLAVLLLAEVKSMKNEISELKAEIAALKGAQ
jgi:hypothetical protein